MSSETGLIVALVAGLLVVVGCLTAVLPLAVAGAGALFALLLIGVRG